MMVVLDRGEKTETALTAETFMPRVGNDLAPEARIVLERLLADRALAMGREEVGRLEVVNSLFGPGNGRLYQITVYLH